MTKIILNIEKRRNRILALRNRYLHSTEKEDNVLMAPTLAKFARVNGLLLAELQKNYNNQYSRK